MPSDTPTQDAALTRHTGNGHAASTAKPSFVSQAPQQWQMAVQLADADIIPKDFRGKPANVFIALEMAHRLGVGPMEVMQQIYIVHGTPSMSAKFLIALANHSGRFRGGLRFEVAGEGDGLSVRCYATDRETGEELSASASMEQAKRAGWTKNSKYREMPEQMLSYRAATFFIRRYCPEVTMGMVTVDEAEEMPSPRDADVDPLDETLTPIEAAPEPTEVYLPADRVTKLLEAFASRGVLEPEVEVRLGDLRAITEAKYSEAMDWFRSLPAEGEPSPTELFADPTENPDYDPAD